MRGIMMRTWQIEGFLDQSNCQMRQNIFRASKRILFEHTNTL